MATGWTTHSVQVCVCVCVCFCACVCVDSQHSQRGGPCPTSCSSDLHHYSSGTSSCSRCGPALTAQDTQEKHTDKKLQLILSWSLIFSHHTPSQLAKTHTACLNLPFTRSTRYSWLGVMSRYWTIEFMVGMEEAFITAACFRLLMLASGGEKSED